MALATRLLSDQPFVTSFLRTSSARLAVAYARTTTLLDAGGLTYHRKGYVCLTTLDSECH